MINEIRRIRIQKRDSNGINGHVSHLLDRGYVLSQSTAIRCLIDSRSDVISLKQLLDDLKKNRDLFTRKNYVSNENNPYNPDDCSNDNERFYCESAHSTFDQLSSSSPRSRTPDDLIDEEVFVQLTKELNICNNIKVFTSKFLAHKADPKSRKSLKKTQLGIALDQVMKCHKAIIRVANYAYGEILREGELGGIPPLYNDNLKYLDKPWVSKNEFTCLHDFWNDHMSTVNNCPNFIYKKKSNE